MAVLGFGPFFCIIFFQTEVFVFPSNLWIGALLITTEKCVCYVDRREYRANTAKLYVETYTAKETLRVFFIFFIEIFVYA